METNTLWARNGEVVRQAIELDEIVHFDTASEELTEWSVVEVGRCFS
jgi:hypothetical protein